METSAQDIEQKAIHLEFVDVGEPLFVECDSGRLQQVFRNIISNAVKFTPVGGSICVTLSRKADNARVVVADTGEGIAPEFLPFVFRMFRQQEQGKRREHDGLGIGLALVKRLTELHHGTVSVVSAGPGRGAEVTVCLPPAAPAPALNAEAASAGGAEPCASALAGLSILVLEDSEDARESLRTLLELFGAKVSIAHDGREALDRVQDAQPDLVLCDLRMPRMDGFEFMRELQRGSTLANLPVVAMSGFASAADRQRTREAGFVAHIGKPFDAATVVATIDATRSRREP